MPLGSTRRTVPGKATKAEVQRRVETVFELRLGGAGFADIREYALAPTDRDGKKLDPWGVSDGQLWRYIAAADKRCKERYDAKADHLLARHLLRRERLYAHCLEVGDYRTALAVLKDAADLEGHYKRDNGSGTLEAFLASLPPGLARATRAALGAALAGAGAGRGGEPPVAPAAGGPGVDPGAGGDVPGPVASESAAIAFAENVAPLFPPER
jgi:hypothetical protein